MIRTNKVRIMIIALLALIPAGCKKEPTIAASNSNAPASGSQARPAAPLPSNSNSTAQPDGSASDARPASSDTSPAAAPADPAKMIGTYEMVQVQKAGVVNMLTDAKTQITFSPEGTYTRVSKIKDKDVHDDHGTYRIEDGNQLVLTIQISKKTIHNPPIEKKHKIALSQDGEELKMISDKGDVAVFRKTKKS